MLSHQMKLMNLCCLYALLFGCLAMPKPDIPERHSDKIPGVDGTR